MRILLFVQYLLLIAGLDVSAAQRMRRLSADSSVSIMADGGMADDGQSAGGTEERRACGLLAEDADREPGAAEETAAVAVYEEPVLISDTTDWQADALLPDSAVADLAEGTIRLSRIINEARTVPQLSLSLYDRLQWEACRGVYEVRASRIAVPVGLTLMGTWRFVDTYLQTQINEGIRTGMATLRGGRYLHFDDYIQYVPAAACLGLEYCGVPSRNHIVDRTFATANSWIVMGVIVNVMKYSFRSMRPDGSTRNSFPSGHTATAFMGAELVRIQYGLAAGMGAYAVALSVGFMRMYNNRHWFNDVLSGAGIGILSARVGHWLLPLEHRWFGLDRLRVRHKGRCPQSIAFCPSYDPLERSAGAAVWLAF